MNRTLEPDQVILIVLALCITIMACVLFSTAIPSCVQARKETNISAIEHGCTIHSEGFVCQK